MCTACRYGGSCARYVKADLPILDAQSSRAASVLVVLGIGIALIVIAVILLAIAIIIIVHQRHKMAEARRQLQAFGWGSQLVSYDCDPFSCAAAKVLPGTCNAITCVDSCISLLCFQCMSAGNNKRLAFVGASWGG